MSDADIIVVGAGAAGLSLTRRLLSPHQPGSRVPSVLLVEPPEGPARSTPRTWCFWQEDRDECDDLVTASWARLRITGRDGASITGPSYPRYKMIRSTDYTRALDTQLASSPSLRRFTGTVTDVTDTSAGAQVTGVDPWARPFRHTGRYVFDSRPPRSLPPARTTLLQHFRGWFVTTEEDHFDPSVAELMDLRTPQPHNGLSFAYVLPLGPRSALVEYTEFSGTVLSRQAYDAALRHYTEHVRPLGAMTVTSTEQGVIPMTDGDFPRRAGRSVFRIGAAGGATRPSTGYTFAALQRQTAAVAAAYRAGRTPVPPSPHARRHRAMDAVLLRALATGRIDGAAFFEDLFRRNPQERVIRFLTGRSTLAEEWAIGLRTPVMPMLRTLAELTLLPRRSPPRLPGAAHHPTSDSKDEREAPAEFPGSPGP